MDTSPVLEWSNGDYTISTDLERFDVDVFHRYLTDVSYWAKGRTRETTDLAVSNSIVFGAYRNTGHNEGDNFQSMIGAARVVTDGATFGWLCDVFVLDEARGHGVGKALVAAVRTHPSVQSLKHLMLVTADAQGLYQQFGFEVLGQPDRWMACSPMTDATG